MMRELARRELNEIHVEAGARLNGALLEAGLVDEILAYVAPAMLGDPARGPRAVPCGPRARSAHCRSRSNRSIASDDDLRIRARVSPTRR